MIFNENFEQLFCQLVIISKYFYNFVDTIKVKNLHSYAFGYFFVKIKLPASRDLFEHHRYYLFFGLDEKMAIWSYPAGSQANSAD